MMDNLEFLRNVGYGKAVDTVDDKPVSTIPGTGQEFSEDTGFTPAEVARLFLPQAQGVAAGEAQDLAPASSSGSVSDIVTVGTFKAQAIVDAPASRFNVATLPVGVAAFKLLDSNDSRLCVTIYNPPGGGTVYVGNNSGVGTGFSAFPVISGNSITMAVSCEIWVSASATGSVAYMEYLI